jgi:hypothetical protein
MTFEGIDTCDQLAAPPASPLLAPASAPAQDGDPDGEASGTAYWVYRGVEEGMKRLDATLTSVRREVKVRAAC